MLKVQETDFGSIKIDGKTYRKDIIITPDGEIKKRKKKLSKEIYGTSHKFSGDEAQYVFSPDMRKLIIGTGQYGKLTLTPEAEEYFNDKNVEVLLKPTPEAIKIYNKTDGEKSGLFHITC